MPKSADVASGVNENKVEGFKGLKKMTLNFNWIFRKVFAASAKHVRRGEPATQQCESEQIDNNWPDKSRIVKTSERYGYQIDSNGRYITISDKRGKTFNDNSSKHWNIIAAAATDNGFSVLKAGTNKKYSGQYQLWFTNNDGKITSGTGWKSGGLMRLNGYETVFGVDLNGDGVISSEITDADNNKIVDGSEEYEYQIYNNGQSITIENKRGRTFNNSSSKHWDIIAAAATDNGFSILKAGTSKNRIGLYQLWFTNTDGKITSGTGWKSGGLMSLNGNETVFGVDLNGDGVISSEITDVDNNKLVDGSEEY